MNYPYDLLYQDLQGARQELARSLQSGPGPQVDTRLPAIGDGAPVTNGQQRTANQPTLSPEFTRSRGSLNNSATNPTRPKRSGWTGNDMSASSFSLTLLLLGTIAAADTNHPVFWLSIGPAPLVAGFTILTFFRKRFSRRGPCVIFDNHDDY
jgi:hypothetical protein